MVLGPSTSIETGRFRGICRTDNFSVSRRVREVNSIGKKRFSVFARGVINETKAPAFQNDLITASDKRLGARLVGDGGLGVEEANILDQQGG